MTDKQTSGHSQQGPAIRRFQPADWPAIADIIKRIWSIGVNCRREQRYGLLVGGRSWHDHKTQSIRAAIDDRPQDWYVTEIQGRVIGFCSLHTDTATEIGTVGENGIHPDYLGKGLGSRQLRFVLALLRERGMRFAEVQTGLDDGHAPARKMYERAGFVPLADTRRYCLELGVVRE